ncbi:glycosyltransferase [Staphylococcus gallinarum]|uniref:glycosyltransferase n=1 Tax=Staphylococcus gallinarum TaxID=1293 RepID=UPI000D1E3E6C|nr:glycosyltransferase [Staphylococcus gallinarum]MCD8918259.1 glycosyltransferase [Staphylococcus gallinarum]PTK96926.1 glycosyl transferase family 1 [Staphylococcus gallinarum]PTK97103.1 glycosyl transferase family 1 [Staphylococcus gallinarum]RIO90179.1 glycosyltransferase [Staphylococcus gallinarum]
MLYTITSTLPPIHGGRTKALLSRIQLMNKELSATNTILTTNYNADYHQVIESFISNGKLGANIKVENVYDWLADYNLLYTPNSKERKKAKYYKTKRKIKGLKHKANENNNNIVRYYDGDDYVLYRKYRQDSDVLDFEDFMTPYCKKRVERWHYNEFGQIHKKTYYSTKRYGKIAEKFYDRNGNKYCEKFFADDDKTTLLLIQLYKKGRMYKAFSTEKQLFEYYFEERLTDGDIVFNDARLLDRPLLNQKNNTKNVLVLHNSHLNNDEVKGSFKFALKHSEKVTKYLVLTEHQKQDIQSVYEIEDEKFAVIPHFTLQKNPKYSKDQPQDRFIYIGRFGHQKQLDHLIKAYHRFRQRGYTTKLVMFGKDEAGQLQMIQDLIDVYKLNEFVEINEFTNNPLLEFNNSRASLLTSNYEGFGLTIMESIDAGCPVVSYDVKYGPREIIEEGKTGYLVEPNNIDDFAEKMIQIVEYPLTNVRTNERLKYKAAVENYKDLLQILAHKKSKFSKIFDKIK